MIIIRCICGVLADNLVILVTHQLQHAQHVDPRELFDDIENVDTPNFVATEIVMEECSDIVEETDQQNIKCSDDIHLIPIEKTRQRVRSENDPVPAFNQICDRGSVYTTPSMFSLISMPNKLEDNTRINIVGS